MLGRCADWAGQRRFDAPFAREPKRWSLRRHKVRCASRRAYVIIVADWLIRLSEDTNGWQAQKLDATPEVAELLDHQHYLTPDAHDQDVLLCRECGLEW